jgi:hypothetical protein
LLFVGVGFDHVVLFPDRFLSRVKAVANGAEGVANDVQGLATILLKGHVSAVCSAKFNNSVIFY